MHASGNERFMVPGELNFHVPSLPAGGPSASGFGAVVAPKILNPGHWLGCGLLSSSRCVAFEQAFDEVRPYTEVRCLQVSKFGPQIDKTAFGAPLEDP